MAKLDRFRETAKGGTVHRVYHEFNSLEEFRAAAVQSAAELRRLLDDEPAAEALDGIPRPPALHAEPPYIGSHEFVGRAAQLQTLNDWAAAAEPHPVLLFEAIGGTGKSMLTWEWTTRHANRARSDWAGIFWYSFYEKGAVMADFCRHALAYMTGQPLADFRTMRQDELTDLLMRRLRARPWLLIMDGLERVLVAYHRADAAQLRDEDAGSVDEIARRDPRAAIRPPDDRLLRQLAGAGPSKILMTSRLVPLGMWNRAEQPVPGVLHETLPGLRPSEAEALIRSAGVRGDSGRIQAYLRAHCDCHPLVTGAVAGLVQDYLPARGDFDAWEADPAHGGHLNLAEMDLVQKRNHVLRSAIEALPRAGRELLSILALLSESVDYPTLVALGSAEHEPLRPETVRDLERRGLLQYDRRLGRYDLHPVVRGVAAGTLRVADRAELGERAVDHFSARAVGKFADVTTLEDLGSPLAIIRLLIQMGSLRRAADHLNDLGLRHALLFNLEAYAEALSLTRPFFTADWTAPAAGVDPDLPVRLASMASVAFNQMGDNERALSLCLWLLRTSLAERSSYLIATDLGSVARTLTRLNRLADADRIISLWSALAQVSDQPAQVFVSYISRFELLVRRGAHDEAAAEWQRLGTMGRSWPQALYRPGEAELLKCRWEFERGTLSPAEITYLLRLTESGRSRPVRRMALALRGQLRMRHGDLRGGTDDLAAAITLMRTAGVRDVDAEASLALARFHLGDVEAARSEAERLGTPRGYGVITTAELWHTLGDLPKATALALDGYRWAWADGEPFVNREALNRSAALLTTLGVPLPRLPAHDRTTTVEFAWEAEVRGIILELAANDLDDS